MSAVGSASDTAVDFKWGESWLTGEQYAHILHNADLYCDQFGFTKWPPRQHPFAIYEEPYNGLMYFVEGRSVGSEFGFPRVEAKKKYRWKKMNFTTELPKRQPVVSYIVASAIKCEKFFPGAQCDGPAFRMHAVVLTDPLPTQSYVLCHVRRLSDSELSTSTVLPGTPRLTRKGSPLPLKKPKKEHSSPTDWLHALLEAAEREAVLSKSMGDSSDEDETEYSQKVATAASSGEIARF